MERTMRVWVSRRRFLALAAGAVPFVAKPAWGRAAEVAPRDLCTWRKRQGPVCRSGSLKEYWCEYCNDPGTGSNPARCEWRLVGRC